jgi:O-antigen/teichoic acid export membrane protein
MSWSAWRIMDDFGPASGVSSGRKIIRNTVFSSLSELSIGFQFIFFILAARYLGDARFGQFTAAIALVGLFTLLVYFGFSFSIVKVILQDKKQTGRYLGNALLIQAAFALISLLACYLTALAFKNKYPSEMRLAILIIFAAETLRCFGFTLRAACKALGAFHWDTAAVYAERIFLVAAGAFVLITGHGLLAVSAVYLISRLISFSVLVVAVARLKHAITWKPDLSVMVQLFKRSAIYVIQSACWRVYDFLDVALLGAMAPFVQVGWYSAGRRVLEGLYLIPNFVTEVTYPEIHARGLVSRDLLRPVFDKAFKYIFAVSVLVALGTIIIAPFLVHQFFGSSFEHTIQVLFILSTAVIPAYCRYLFGSTLIAIERQRAELAISAGRGVLNIVLNVFLIRHWGFLGAALATSLTDWTVIGFYLLVLKREGLIYRDQLHFLWKPLLIGVILTPIYFLPLARMVVFLLLIIMYCVFLLSMKFFEPGELDAFREFILHHRKKLKSQ